ncbi:MAG TPA: DUF3313 family protein [Gammaproteobacteria bacterium]
MRTAMRGKIALWGFVAGMAALTSACAAYSSTGAGFDGGSAYDLSRYERVMVDPVEVEFDENWDPVKVGSHLTMSEHDREKTRQAVAAMFDHSFREELTAGSAVQLVDSAGPGVLRITPVLQEVSLSAAAPLAHPGATYVRTVGNVTLHVVFRDAASGEQVLELHDRVRGRDIGLLRTASPVYNEQELTRIFEDWAQVIRQDIFHAP